MTKAEFLDQLASDDRIGSKKAAADAVDSVLDTISDALGGGGDVNFTGFGKFHVAERGARQGVNPRTGERITIAGGKGPALLRRLRPEVQGQGLSDRPEAVRGPARGTRRRAPQPGLPRTRPGPGRARRRAACGAGRGEASAAAAAEAAAAAVSAHCRGLIERAGPACVAVKAPARLLRAPRRARLGGARRRSARPPATPACWCSPTASAATSRSPPAPTPRRCWAGPRRPGARSRGWAPTRSPPTRCSAATRSSR